MTTSALDGRGARFLYYLLNGDTRGGHDDDYDHPKADEATLQLPRQRVCVLTNRTDDTKSPAGAVHRTAGFLLSGDEKAPYTPRPPPPP
jgi:hypothetical protein